HYRQIIAPGGEVRVAPDTRLCAVEDGALPFGDGVPFGPNAPPLLDPTPLSPGFDDSHWTLEKLPLFVGPNGSDICLRKTFEISRSEYERYSYIRFRFNGMARAYMTLQGTEVSGWGESIPRTQEMELRIDALLPGRSALLLRVPPGAGRLDL